MPQAFAREAIEFGNEGEAVLEALVGSVDHLEGCACAECAAGIGDKAPGPGEGAEDTVPGNNTSTATVAVGGYVSGSIDTEGDHDWYQVQLVAGQTYTFQTVLSGSGLPDSMLVLRDAAGNQIAQNDDAASAPNHYTFSEITFTATTTGTYFLDVSGFETTDVGTFSLTVSAPTADAVAGSSATTASLVLGTATNGMLDANGDQDWYAVTLTAGTAYVFNTSATGGPSDPDTTLFLRDASGALLAYNDDASGTYSQIRFTPTASGTYYLNVAAWGNAETGAYRVKAELAPPIPIFTNDEIAFQLTNTYWGGTARKWNVGPGGTLTYNIVGLTPEGQFLAREALNLWTDATGIIFNEVGIGGQITFDDNQSGASATSTRIGGFITSSSINVSVSWLTSSGSTLRSYTFQAYVHEIGHALGLGHGGNYNTTADYAVDASYQNDSWATTVMSYFDQVENTYFAAQGFSRQFSVTPMIADLIAVQDLYGVNTTTRTGNNTYGVGNNTGRDAFTFALGQPSVGYVIVDNGGIDTMDYSTSNANQRIDLNQEAFSNIGGGTGNVSIARGTVIENAVGGNGGDTLIGNAVANQLSGGPGNDTIIGGGGADTLLGGGDDDIITGGAGDDSINGGAGGNDEARFFGNLADYQIDYVAISGSTWVRITGNGSSSGDGVDVLRGVEFAKFSDTRISIVLPDNLHPVLSASFQTLFGLLDGQPFNFQIPADAYTDPDPGTVLSFTATLADGSPLPAWLSFDPAARTFSGTPPLAAVGTILEVKVTVADNVPGDPLSRVSTMLTMLVVESDGPNVVGTPGSDTLAGTFRREEMYGLDGDDILVGSLGADWLDGGDGNDTVDYSGSNAIVSVDLGWGGHGMSGYADADFFVSIENLIGSAFDDYLVGDSGANLLFGRGGNDVLGGGLGNDTIDGGDGSSDTVRFDGNRGDYLIENVLIDGNGWVRVTGLGALAGDGVDLLRNVEFLEFADQTIRVANQRPVLGSTSMPDQNTGDGALYTYQVPLGAFSDPDGAALTYTATLADGSPLPGWLSFNPATRTFSGTPPFAAIGTVLQVRVTATDNFPGDPLSLVSDVFALTIVEAPGADVNGTANPDTLNGTFRAERMFGLDSDDVLNGSDGADQIDGGNGSDTVSYAGSGSAVAVVLSSGQGSSGQAAGDSYVSIENVTGSTFGDLLIGNAGANVLTGGGGIDTLDGGAGNDRLVVSAAGSGTSVDGGADSDTLVVSGAVTPGAISNMEAIELVGGASLTLSAAQFNTGFYNPIAQVGMASVSGTGSLILNLDPNPVTAALYLTSLSFVGGSSVTLTINGTSGLDAVKGAPGVSNIINGGDEADQIRGGSRADTIDGGNGNDKLFGWSGADVLTGGAGSDQFRYFFATDSGLGAAADRITDFQIGTDKFNFVIIDADPVTPDDQAFAFIGTGAFTSPGTGQIRFQDSGADLLVQVDVDGNGTVDMEVVLQGLAGQVLTSGDFML